MPRLLLRLFLLMVVAGVALDAHAEPDIVIDGKKLPEWMAALKGADRLERGKATQAFAALASRTPHAVAEAVATLLEAGTANAPAVEALAQLRGAAVPALTHALFSDDLAIRAQAVFTLERLGSQARPATAALVQMLDDPDRRIRFTVTRALGGIGRAAVPALARRLTDPDGDVSRMAALSLLRHGVPAEQVLPAVQDWLKSAEPTDQSTALGPLLFLGPEGAAALPAVRRALTSTDATVRQAALACLGQMGSAAKDAAPALKELLANPKLQDDHLAGAKALWAVARDPAALKTLQVLAEKHVKRAEAALTLWRYSRDASAVKPLVEPVKPGTKGIDPYIEALGKIGPAAAPQAVEPLRAMLKEPAYRTEATVALGRLGPAARAAVKDLAALVTEKGGTPDDRFVLATALVRIQPDEANVRLVADLLTSKSPEVRDAATLTLATLGPAAAPALPALRKLLAGDDPQDRQSAAVALWRIARAPEALTVTTALLQHPDSVIRMSAATEIGYTFGADAKGAVPVLAKLLWDDAIEVRFTTLEALARIGPDAKATVPALTAILSDDRLDELHSAAAEALGLIGPAAKAAVPVLKQRLEHPEPYARACAALALWNIAKEASGEKALTPLLDHRNHRVRVTAAEALGRMKAHPRAVPVLLEVLRGEDFATPTLEGNRKYMAARALARIGPAAAPTLDALRELLTSEDFDLVAMARTAIKQIEGK